MHISTHITTPTKLSQQQQKNNICFCPRKGVKCTGKRNDERFLKFLSLLHLLGENKLN